MESSFSFKQFTIRDDKSSMKVGTDAVLLGSWVNIGSAENILDIGTGSGVIALMLAQRSDAQIQAIDIDNELVLKLNDYTMDELSPLLNKLNQDSIDILSSGKELVLKIKLEKDNER